MKKKENWIEDKEAIWIDEKDKKWLNRMGQKGESYAVIIKKLRKQLEGKK